MTNKIIDNPQLIRSAETSMSLENNLIPGVENFYNICKQQQEIPHQNADGAWIAGAQANNFKEIIKNLVGKGTQEDADNLIRIISDGPANEDEIWQQIVIDGEEVQPKLPGEAIIEIIIEEAQAEKKIRDQNTDDDLGIEISVDRVAQDKRIQKLANALGVNPEQIKYDSIEQLLTYMSLLIERTDEISDFDAATETLKSTNKQVPVVAMMTEGEVVRQVAADCTLFALVNLDKAAINQAGVVAQADVGIMQATIPFASRGSYRNMGSVEYADYAKSLGFDMSMNFNWLEAMNNMMERKAGLVLRVVQDHAVAVVGIRQNEKDNEIDFLVANSLPGYGFSKSEQQSPLFWINAKELINKTVTRPAGYSNRLDNFMMTWNKID